jgi:serpin B
MNRSNKDFRRSFSEKLMEQIVGNAANDDNIAVSPSRLQAVLVLLSNWASPDMQRKILDVAVGESAGIEDANEFCRKDNFSVATCYNISGEVSESPIVELSTILWLQEQLRLKAGHIADMREAFGVEYERVDFANPDTQGLIDAKINEASHGFIPSLNAKVDPLTRVLLTDILYFKAHWEIPFEEENTDELPFYGAKETVDVPTMCMEERLPYKETDKYQMVELSYLTDFSSEKSYVMRIYLPRLCVSNIELLRAIAEKDAKQEVKEEHVCLYLPRFSAETDIKMTNIFQQLGLKELFTSTDILPQLADNIQISDIAQKVKIIVNETETEAVALTSIVCAGCLPPEEDDKPIVMTVDRPFLFEIVEETSGTILFTGIINDIE